MKVCWWLLVLALGLTRGDTDWSNSCPSICKCKWISGKKVAECTSQGLSTVPDRLSPEIQSIDLSSNTLRSLPSEAFRAVGLVNLHKIYLRECGIVELHKDAFKGLEILIELDLSNNRIHSIHPGTFRDNVRLRILLMHHNPLTKLEDGLFTNMTYLQTVDVTSCHLSHIGHKTFVNVPVLHNLLLANNGLVHMKVAVVEPLTRLISLDLRNNPWRCDCHLKAFRDWTMEKNLYADPTTCAEPSYLANQKWSEIDSSKFACKPQIVYPPPEKSTTVEALGEEVTLSCKVAGNPSPEVYWVVNSRIISNNTRSSYGDSRYTVREGGGWVNLTIGRVRVQDRGELTCVAKSPGGVDERNVTLLVSPGSGLPHSSRGGENWPLILGLITGLVALLVIVLVLCCCLCRRSRRRPPPKKMPDAPNGDLNHPEKSLLTVVNPVQKPPRRYEDRPAELAEVNRNLLDDTGTSVGGDFEDRSTESAATTPCLEPPHYPPDLLAFPRGMSSPPHLSSPTHGTLPYSRSQSPFSPTRPGYVTIPRRPRVPSWSSAPTPTLLEDPLGLLKLEPVYDNLGPRTTADGSSVLSLNKSVAEPPTRPRPQPLPQHCSTLPTPRKVPRQAPEGAPLPRTVSAEGPLSPSRPKVPPKPPPKPKKNGPLYEDEGEDGTEV
uniref:Ig-like domain-containing protein n=1 Tax=Graphocephala atropunctata TaxID=36148 RepID=A0A1B6KZX6_9HEMI